METKSTRFGHFKCLKFLNLPLVYSVVIVIEYPSNLPLVYIYSQLFKSGRPDFN